MFKKPFAVKSQSQLKSSDKRKIRAEIQSSSLVDLDDTTLDLLFPTKSSGDAGLVVAIKFISHSGDVGTIYTVNGQPMFFRTDAGLFPTVYALWIHPGLLFSMPTHGAVMKKLFDGADLMLPGVHKSRMDSSKAAGKVVGDACSVLITGYPFPLSVGSLLVAGSDLINPAFDWRGRGVKTVHFFQDFLWASGDKSEPPPVREELSAGGVGSGGGVNQIVDDDDEEEEGKEERDGQDNDNDLVIVEQTEDDLDIVDWVEMQQQQQQPQEDQDSMIQQVQQSTESMQLAEDASPSTTTPSLSPAAMDELLETAFYTAISLKIPQEDSKLFPMLSSILYSTYILPSRPADTALDISKTTFKKLQKFLKAMEKKGVLKLKERNSELVITAISFKHPNVLAFIPPRRLACDQPLQSTLSSSSPTNAVTSTSAANNNTASGDVGVEDLYKPVGDLIPILKEIGVECSSETNFTVKQVRQHLTTYVKTKNLMNGNKIILDMYLCALLTKEESKSSTTPDTIPRDQLVDRFIKKCQQCYEIKLPGKDAVFKFGVPPVIQISVKLRSGNKKVTSVARFETYGISSTELSSELKIICASSTSVTPLPGKGVNAGDEVMVQGDKVKEICELLQGKYGITFKLTGSGKKTTYTSRFVEVVYAKGAK